MTSQNTIFRCEYCGKPREKFEVIEGFASGNLGFKPCDCRGFSDAMRRKRKREEQEALQRRSEALRVATLRAGVKKRYLSAEHPRAAELAQAAAGGKSLYIVGDYGTGKTHLASAIVRALVEHGRYPLMLTGVDMLMQLQSTFGSAESEAEAMERFTKCDVLVLDDLGKEPPSDWVLSRLYAIVNDRYSNDAPVVITSNYQGAALIERLSRHGDQDSAEAILSRLHEMCKTVVLDGKDWRME